MRDRHMPRSRGCFRECRKGRWPSPGRGLGCQLEKRTWGLRPKQKEAVRRGGRASTQLFCPPCQCVTWSKLLPVRTSVFTPHGAGTLMPILPTLLKIREDPAAHRGRCRGASPQWRPL